MVHVDSAPKLSVVKSSLNRPFNESQLDVGACVGNGSLVLTVTIASFPSMILSRLMNTSKILPAQLEILYVSPFLLKEANRVDFPYCVGDPLSFTKTVTEFLASTVPLLIPEALLKPM